MDFEFASATRIVFGPGKLREAAPGAKGLGKRAFIVTGRSPERARTLKAALENAGLASTEFAIRGEPTIEAVKNGAQAAKEARCDLVIGFGGGSAIDAAKAVAALLANPGDIFEYLEVIGQGKALPNPSAPCIAIPTTAGTGAEVTRNAVLASPEHKFKVSLRSASMLPRLAIVDPELTYDLPPEVTATTGLDALTQLIEPYVSCRANPITDGFCLEGMRRAARSLFRVFENGTDPQAREDMSLASLLGGLSLANAGLGAVHGFAAPIGGMYPAPHGAVCAALLPHVMSVNIRALSQRASDGEALRRYARVAQVLTGKASASVEEGATWVRELTKALQIKPLRHWTVRMDDAPELVAKAAQASSMKANPLPLTPEELREILTLSV